MLENAPDQMTAVLLHEFATGTGPKDRHFYQQDRITNEFVYGGSGYVFRDTINGLYREVNKAKITYKKFLKLSSTNPVQYGLAFSPDQTSTLTESWNKHWDSNAIQFFVAGATIRAWPSKKDGFVDIEIINDTSRQSLMLHIGDNYERSKGPLFLSTVSQHFYFSFKIDPERFPKQ